MIKTLKKIGLKVFAENDFSDEYGELYITNDDLLKKNLVLYYNCWIEDDKANVFSYYEELSVIALNEKNYSKSASIFFQKKGSEIGMIILIRQTLEILSNFSGKDLFEVIKDLCGGDNDLYIEGDENEVFVIGASTDESRVGKTFTRGDNESEKERIKYRNEVNNTLQRVIKNF